jgi:hypothetical protein
MDRDESGYDLGGGNSQVTELRKFGLSESVQDFNRKQRHFIIP